MKNKTIGILVGSLPEYLHDALARRMNRLEEISRKANEKGQDIFPFSADVSNDGDIQNAVDFALEKFGRIDVLVNCAGIMDNMVPIDEMNDELWDKVLSVNLTGPMKLTRLVIREMLKQGEGNIINIASVGGLHGCRAGTAYTVSKHGVIGMTKNIAYMYAGKGIRCNAICPGAVETEIGVTGVNNPSPAGIERAMKGIGLNPRNGTPEEIAHIALFLASGDSRFVNGASIVADAGWTAY